MYRRLSNQFPIRDPDDVSVIGGNSEALYLKSFTVLLVSLGTNLLWYDFGVVPNLPLKVFIEAHLLEPNLCFLQYQQNNKKRLQFGVTVCAICNRFCNDSDVGSLAQLRFVDRIPRRNQNWLKNGYNFLATLPEGVCSDSDEETQVRVDETAEKFGPLARICYGALGRSVHRHTDFKLSSHGSCRNRIETVW